MRSLLNKAKRRSENNCETINNGLNKINKKKRMKEILVGSNAFFKGIEEFKTKNKDYVIFVENPEDFKIRKEIRLRGTGMFYYKRLSPAEMINYTLETNDPLLIGKFLVPEVAEELNLSVSDILPLEPMLSKLGEQYQYQVIIFNHIKNNNSFTLTNEQLDEAYQVYISARKEEEKNK